MSRPTDAQLARAIDMLTSKNEAALNWRKSAEAEEVCSWAYNFNPVST